MQVFSRARNRSFPHTAALAIGISLGYVAPSMVPEALDIVFDCLSIRRQNFDFTGEISLEAFTFRTIAAIASLRTRDRDDIITVVLRHWPILFTTLTEGCGFSDASLHLAGDGLSPIQTVFIDTSAEALYSLGLNLRFSGTILTRVDVARFVGRLWFLQDPETFTTVWPYATHLLSTCIFATQSNGLNMSPNLDAVVAGAGCSVDDIAETAVGRLMLSLRRRAEKHKKCILLYRGAIISLAAKSAHPLLNAFLRKRATYSITRATAYLSDQRLHGNNVDASVFSQYFGYLSAQLEESSRAALWMKEAVISGLYSIYVNYNSAMTDCSSPLHFLVRSVLVDRIAPFLVFRSILSASERAFSKLSTEEVAALCDGSLGKEWKAVTALLLERLAIKFCFDRTLRPSLERCRAVSATAMAVSEC